MARHEQVKPTEEWAELKLRLEWPEQVKYELIRPPLLSDVSVAERSRQTGASESRLRRGITGFKSYGMSSLFESEEVEGHSQLDPEVCGLILNLKSEHAPMRDNEIATICYVRFGVRPHGRTVRRVLETQPAAIRMFRRFKPYHKIEDSIERRLAIMTLHSEGWNVKTIAGYLKTSHHTVVSDGAGIFKASQAKAVYRALGIKKEVIEKRQPWQNFVETTFNIQRRMADYYFAKAESWEELVAAHDGWVERYNIQKHRAHEHRKDARRSPAEVLGFLTGVRHKPEDLRRTFFSTRFTRVLDASGYARLKHWRIYAEEELARREVALWLGSESLVVEFGGDTLARYDAEYSA